jgi:hypothetical protein
MQEAVGVVDALRVPRHLGADHARRVAVILRPAHTPDGPPIDNVDLQRAGRGTIVRAGRRPALDAGQKVHGTDGPRFRTKRKGFASLVSTASKRLDAMRRNPKGDWTIQDVISICWAYGIACTAPSRGSHYDVSHPLRADILTVPYNRPIRPVYIRKLVAFVDAVKEASDG